MKREKKLCIIGFFFTSILGTLAHFFYQWSENNPIVGFFAPVNESIWEHMKLTFFPCLLYCFWLFKLSPKKPLDNTLSYALLVGNMGGIWLMPLLFYSYVPISRKNILFLDILIFLLSVLFAFSYAYKFSASEKMAGYKKSILFFTWIYIVCFILFTRYPPDFFLFHP